MLSAEDQLRACFAVGDPARFDFRRKPREGVIVRTNPRRAVVQTSHDIFHIPYERLLPNPDLADRRMRRIREVHQQAVDVLQLHGLKAWRFRFDHSTRRAGCCSYHDRSISISIDLAVHGSEADIRDTILHETAHALVGSKHGHDRIWKAKAIEIGGTGTRTHRTEFSVPRWKVRCENACWQHTAQRRSYRLVCRQCGGRLVYSPITHADGF